ncbi:TRAP transporter substrate-binding protein [Paraburkholderia dipogonis]|uniref:TRAP transporter substrate-binding protein n=1 Tax=Paraburkholderia dipogonis TaxID=1211383 RepID=A0A4Y8MHA3_9BURK|nr:TRAP transporter substrate-binding protein [Paraburkholderia dipogonis]TFE36811.1 TRAP transporter substrate-binding protein [Paraburkholderia dipogonis]
MPGFHTRRKFLAASAALPLFSIYKSAQAADFKLKLATGQDPEHPLNKRCQEAINRIAKATNNRVRIQLFPANQLGSDVSLLSQVRSGAVDLFDQSMAILATAVPAASIPNIPFAWNDYGQIWTAMDGQLGAHIRTEIAKAGLVTVGKAFDNGFRHVTTSGKSVKIPEDLRGLKIRVPPSPIVTSLFSSLGAGPTPIPSSDLYTALQTKVVDGQENSLSIIQTLRLYEVQKTCSLTAHVWDGFWMLANQRKWTQLPKEFQDIINAEFSTAAVQERSDLVTVEKQIRTTTLKSLTFETVDRPSFRRALAKTDFYTQWRTKIGPEGWSLLENASGKLA